MDPAFFVSCIALMTASISTQERRSRLVPTSEVGKKQKALLDRFFQRQNPHLRSSLSEETQFTRCGVG